LLPHARLDWRSATVLFEPLETATLPITILMPMAGRGSRFARHGRDLPKPLIPVRGIPMFRLALASLRKRLPEAALVCVVLAEHEAAFGIGGRLREADAAARIVAIPEVTGGALETCLAASATCEGALVVLDCDLTFAAPAYIERLRAMAAGDDDSAGLLLSFRSRAPQYSYAMVEDGRVLRTEEKNPVSDHALTGAYGFGDAAQFFATARDIVERNLRTGNGEYYVSSVYNGLIADGGTVRIADVERVWSVGTPEELAAALRDRAFPAHLRMLGLTPAAEYTSLAGEL
jgi:dTDP-glucose pyrophosphorylase